MVVFVGRRHVLLEQPSIVAFDIEGHLEANAHELRGRRYDAFLRHQGTNRMDRLKAWR